MSHFDMPPQPMPLSARLIGWTFTLVIGGGLVWRLVQALT